LPSRSTTAIAGDSRPSDLLELPARAAPALTPILFSFNNPRAPARVQWLRAVLEYDESLIVPHPGKSVAQGALDPWTKPRYEGRRRILREAARAKGIPLDAPWKD